MHTGAYVAAPYIDHVTILHIGHIGLEGPGWLCELTEHLMVQPWSLKEPALGVTRHFAKVLVDRNDDILPFCLL